MTHYRMSFDDWLEECRLFYWPHRDDVGPELVGVVHHEDAADYVRDCIANQTARDIDGRMG